MARARSFLLLGVAVWLAACAESSGPPVPQSPLIRADGQLHHLRWQSTPAPREFAALGSTVVRRSSQSGPAASTVLDTYELAFWAAHSRDQEIQISYRAADGAWQPYVRFKVPKGALLRRPDGTAFADGDSVLITLTVDPTTLVVRFEPTGLEFSPEAPAQLSVWYTGANPDFDASGAVDGTDSHIEQELLRVWVQQAAGAPWTLVTAAQSIPNKLFSANLAHFTDYTLSW